MKSYGFWIVSLLGVLAIAALAFAAAPQMDSRPAKSATGKARNPISETRKLMD